MTGKLKANEYVGAYLNSDRELRSCVALWRAVIAQAIRDLALHGDLDAERQRIKLAAALWFGVAWDGGQVRAKGTANYREACEMAGMGWTTLRDRIDAIIGMDLSEAARCFALNGLAFQIQLGPLCERAGEGPEQ